MPARTGAQYIADLKKMKREIWIGGERVEDVTTHPATRRGVASYAHLYDMQHDPALRDVMTYPSPTTGERVGMSFLTPRTPTDLALRREMMRQWANYSGGMMGRTPDYVNSVPSWRWPPRRTISPPTIRASARTSATTTSTSASTISA